MNIHFKSKGKEKLQIIIAWKPVPIATRSSWNKLSWTSISFGIFMNFGWESIARHFEVKVVNDMFAVFQMNNPCLIHSPKIRIHTVALQLGTRKFAEFLLARVCSWCLWQEFKVFPSLIQISKWLEGVIYILASHINFPLLKQAFETSGCP